MNNKSIPKWFSMLLLMLVAGVTGAWSESLTILDFSIAAGGEKEVAISLEANNASVYGIQTDITLSEGLTLVEAKSAVDGIDAFTNVVSSGATRIVQLSMNKAGAQIPVGNVINLKVKAADNFESGTIELSNTRLTIGTNGQELKMEGTSIAEVTLEQAEEWVWRDIHIDLTNANLLEESEQVEWGTINPFGIAVDKDGVVSRVAADADDSRATVQGKWHSNSCWASLLVTVNVEGPVKVTCGTQPWSDSPVTIKVGNETVASFSNKGNLWTSTATENVVFGYYKGSEPATLTINGGGYPTYIAIEAVDPADIPNDATVTFDAANAGAEGLAPAAQKVEIGSTVKIPANTTLFIEGKTLTAWTDGTNQYKIGDEVTVNEDMTLTPVFTTNTVSFADRTAETTITWLFGESNGVGTLNAQGKSTILVAQVTIGDETIDMKMNIDATNGKINNVGRGDKWAQCNDGTILTIPAYKGTAVSFDSHSDGTGTTIGGVEATNKEAIYHGTAETLDIVAKGMGYIASVKAVYPAPEEPVAESNYYVVGSMSGWGPKEEYRMTRNQKAEGEEYMITMALTTSTMFKVAKSEDGKNISDNDWYPTGMGNSYGENGEITADGEYTIYFRPNADGGDDWFYNVIYVAANQPGEDEWKFRDFNTELNTLLTDNDGSGTTVTFGLSVAEDGIVSRVEADAENTAAVVTGKTGNNHGLQNFSATVPVEGAVKITMGTCSWGGEVTVKNADGETVATFTTKKGEGGTGCYKGNKFDDENIVSAKYVGDATTLTISGGGYVNFFAVEAIEASSVEVAYSLGEVECEGDILPTGGTYAAGDEYTIPAKNFTLYKEGYTLTAWSDGKNEYATGSTITLSESITLTPVFTQNEVSLADRTEPVTVKFDFQRNNGAPSVQWQNKDNLVWVAQAEVNGKTIDVATRFSTNPGKFNNTNWGDWAQLNEGTTFKIPSCKGATISIEAYNALGTGDKPTTIDGQSDYTSGKAISYEIAGAAETVDVVIGNEGSYYRYIQTVLPVVQSQGGETFDNVAASATWPMDEPTNYAKCNVDPASAFSTTAVDLGVVRLMDQNGKENATGTSNVSSGVTFSQMRPTNDGNDYVTWSLKPAAGLTFTPKKISAYIVRFGTDAENGVTISAKAGEGEAVTLGNYTAPRNNKDQAGDKYGSNTNYAVNGLVEIELTEEQQAALETGETLYIMGTIGVGNTKAGGIAQVTVSGVVNGTKEAVDIYTLSAVADPEEAGTVSKYPNADEYEAGTEVTLTATENFGYDFVNWTNAAGDEVSTDAKFKYTVNSNEILTANFQAVETYELALTVDGTNDYMVTVSPAPEVVDGKWMYEAGTAVQLTANQYEGLVTFTNWSDGETNSSKLISMTEDVTLTAFYAQADIIAGWDFYKAGNNGRKADFYAEDNDADALNLVNTETGDVSGWLDKSTLGGGGYESFAGAAVNWRTGTKNGDVGNWHWQTKVNAAAFTDVNVQFQMLYNYNAYQRYNAEYSLDGEEWTNFGSITMEGAKNAASFSEKLPEACNNQKDLYIRMIADKTSNVDGTASANDGNTLAMFFITGTPKIVDDGKAPVLVSTVPADNATGVSASGKVVLTFDERVKIADGTKATLGTIELTPAVNGKVVTFEYKGLDYSTEYTFTLPANTVGDLTNNKIAEPITITFTTMVRPTVEKKPYDAVVENVDELLAAIAEAQSRSDKNVRYRIFIKNGEYTIPVDNAKMVAKAEGYEVPECITFINTNNLSIIGESRDGVIITNGIDKNATFAGTYGTTSKYDGIGNSDVFQLSGSDYYFQDLTVESGMDDATGRDLAIQDKATRTIYKNTGLRGYQDTWTSNNDNGLYYFEDGYLRGRTDYMCGKGDAFYNRVEFQQVAGGYAAVPSVPAKIGWVMKDCTINGDGDGVDGNYTLGRPWGKGTPVALWIDTKMNVVPSAVGWNEMSGGWPARFAEYNSMTSSGSQIDLSGRKKTFGDGHENNPVLTAEEALEFGNLHNMFGDWDPTLATEQAPIVTDVKLTDNELSWTGSNYALLYAIVKNGSVIDFTTDTTYDISNAPAGSQRAGSTDQYQIRAANEMGGLNEASEVATETDGIETVNDNVNVNLNDNIYNLQGIRVNKAQKGVYIIGGRKVVVK